MPPPASRPSPRGLAHTDGGRRSGVTIKSQLQDFVVQERLGYEPTGSGPHVWLRIRKAGLDTARVARLLGDAAGLRPMAVGYAGRKDRHALTSQWFSVALESRLEPDWAALLPRECEVLEVTRSQRKLRVGALKGNRFELVLRAITANRSTVDRRLEQVSEGGFANYFGPQRFGPHGANLAAAAALFTGQRRVRDRARRGLYWSAARSHLFNLVLAARVRDGTWDRILDGEVAMLDGTRSTFAADAGDVTLSERARGLDIHPTGPLWGRWGDRVRRVSGAAKALEWAVLEPHQLFRDGLEAARVAGARRALRVPVREMRWAWLSAVSDPDQVLRLECFLPAGSYATVLVEQVCGAVHDAARGEVNPVTAESR